VKIRRIVVGLDTAAHSRSALAAAAALAGELDAELEALFVESEELHRLAALPFARELGVASATARRIDPAALERSLRAVAQEARRSLTALAVARELRWTFRVARGSVTEQLLAATSPSDISVVGITRWGPEAWPLTPDTSTTLLVIPQGVAPQGPLAAILYPGTSPEQAVPLLCSLAKAVGDGLVLLVVNDDLAAAGHWCEAAGALLDARGRKAQLEIVRADQPEALQAALERLAPRAVAIVAASPRP